MGQDDKVTPKISKVTPRVKVASVCANYIGTNRLFSDPFCQ